MSVTRFNTPADIQTMAQLGLYWVRTRDHHEDCFIVSDSKRHAREFFEANEGYNPHDAKAELVEPIPIELSLEEGYAGPKTLKSLGYRSVSSEKPPIYTKHGKTFVFGSINYHVFLDALRNISGVYCIRCAGSNYYKIGLTSDLHLRLKKLQTGCPFRLVADFFIPHNNAKVIEKALQVDMVRYRTQFEWYEIPKNECQAFFDRAEKRAVSEWNTVFHCYRIHAYEARLSGSLP